MKTTTTGKARIYANERTRQDGSKYMEYSTALGNKKQDGTWENAYPKVNFAKCQPPQIQSGGHMDIEIDDGFFAYDGNYTPKFNNQPITRANGKILEVPVYKVVVMAWHAENQQPVQEVPDSFAVVDEDDPF